MFRILDFGLWLFLLVELIVATTIICSTLLASSQMLSALGSKYYAGFRRLAGARFMQSELEKVQAVKDSNWDNLPTSCTVDSPCHSSYSEGAWRLDPGALESGGYSVGISVAEGEADTKEITAKVSWLGFGEGTLQSSLLLTNPTAEQGQQASYLSVDVSSASVGGPGGKQVNGIVIENTGDSSISIDKITPTWSVATQINDIIIDGSDFWVFNGAGTPDGKQSSGTELDGNDHTLLSSESVGIDQLGFSANMTGTTLSLVFTMSDSSTKTVTVF